MKVLTQYILTEFLKPFLMAVAGFSVLFLLVQIFNDMHFIMEFKPNFWVALKYFSLHIPGFIIQIIPIACLFGVLFSLSSLSKGNELIAMRAGESIFITLPSHYFYPELSFASRDFF